ncbi:MAG: hypothetical protein AAGF07_00115 [Patescibacteria group bacterium]
METPKINTNQEQEVTINKPEVEQYTGNEQFEGHPLTLDSQGKETPQDRTTDWRYLRDSNIPDPTDS